MGKVNAFIFILTGILIINPDLVKAYPYQDTNLPVETRVEDLLSRMTLNEKIGQMTQCSTDASPSMVASNLIGSVLCGGHQGPGGTNSAVEWADMYDRYQQAAISTRLGIPIIFGIDAVHGHNKVRDAVVFPHNIGLGAANDANLIERIGIITAEEVAATGIDWTFGPCLAVPRDERWGRTYEGFAEDPQIHDNLAAPYILGMQGYDTNHMPGNKIVTCAKHYIADGGTTGGVNAGNTECTEDFLYTIHLPPYQRALDANVQTFMTSFSSWNGDKCVFHSFLIGLLKGELQFDGFVVSDWEDIGAPSANIKNAINAGVDMSMAPTTWSSFITNLTSLVNTSQVPQSRIDDAVKRILRVKFRAGLFERPLTDRSLLSTFGSAEHREVGREAVRKSLVLLKNDGVLPIAKNADVFVAGSSANSLIRQCGGWTIGWQGMSSETSTSGNTILDGIQMLSTGPVTFNASGSGAAGHDIAIVAVGEPPYAEGNGDDSDLHLSSTDITTINTVRASGTPYVIVLVSGRPMIITDEIADAYGFIAAWLPGTQGEGIADMLFGNYNFQGRLSFTWPRDMSQIPINVGDEIYNPDLDPLFTFGFGMGTGADLNWDGNVDFSDLGVFANSWLKMPSDSGYAPRVNLDRDSSGIIDFLDFAIFTSQL